jgi:hypothetical protein
MNCPRCQFKLPFRERICRRCQFCADLNTYVSTDAPRKSKRGVQRISRIHHVFSVIEMQSLRLNRRRDFHPNFLLLAGVIPGVGHMLSGRWKEGLLFIVVVPALIATALLSPADTTNSLTLLGLAAGLHVTSLFRLTVLSKEGLFARVLGNAAILIVLLVIVYGPLTTTLMRLKPEFTTMRTYVPGQVISATGLMLMILVGSWILSKFLSLIFSLPEKKRT